jgi:hypothetical protein
MKVVLTYSVDVEMEVDDKFEVFAHMGPTEEMIAEFENYILDNSPVENLIISSNPWIIQEEGARILTGVYQKKDGKALLEY